MSPSLQSDRLTWENEELASVEAGTKFQVSAFDFRSDITTSTSGRQFQAILGVSSNDGWTASGSKVFEDKMADLAGRAASLFMISSTMSNQVAIRTHLNRPPNGIICDARSHIMHQEVGAIGQLSGALPLAIYPQNGLYLTLEDIEENIVLSDGTDTCTCPTRLLHLENPLGGVVMPVEEMKRIKQYADKHSLTVHMDGARLWEAVACGAGKLEAFCSQVHSLNLCLTKGLGGSVGSFLVGDSEFIRHAKWVRKSLGGSMRQPGWVAAAGWAAVGEVFGQDPSGQDAWRLRRTHDLARRLAKHWEDLGGRLVVPQQTNMVWLDLDAAGIDEDSWESGGQERGILLHCSRLVTHYQISDEAVVCLEQYMADMMQNLQQRRRLQTRIPRPEAVARLAKTMRRGLELARLQGYRK
ncbi:hypothetical protein JX265_001997 [Neoarthrinium moseri]|uniref:Aromatic amino acid beta-eliminating lyase/threonine aldolase domain-containing protein n=1 Tax=Neoarthrinium moseri TaxID=1658444 RepID=A0A9P9WWN0_9PEZI|nr:hypothetical protein JX265_001997 [Neoarthrinium moseri]